MTLLLNWLLPSLCVLIVYVVFLFMQKQKTKKGEIKVAAIGIVCIILLTLVYNGVQTTYLPKGSVKPLPQVHFEPKQLEVRDLTAKPKEREFEDFITVREEVEEVLRGPAKTVTDEVAEQMEYQRPPKPKTQRDHQNVYE